jgi:flavin reductase (DIM6/NTAB) family NADH-FMN oxidoreductase RutF
LKHLLTGLTISREYVCVSLDDLQQPLSVVATSRTPMKHLDVTAKHVFLGYKPTLIALDSMLENFIDEDEICLNFINAHFEENTLWKGFQTDKNCIARLLLKKIKFFGKNNRFVLYQGVYGVHNFLSTFHQQINNLREKRRKQSETNVGLPGNQYDQVRIAYSVARVISLITVGNTEIINMFPTDLHGTIGENYYVSSLRIGGKANEQVEGHRKLVLSSMPVTQYQAVYALGKNHVKDMQSVAQFRLHNSMSKTFGIPFPADALHYYELSLIDSFDAGIHRIHLYEKINENKIADGHTLAHIHQYYMQWRFNHDLETKFFYV